MFQTRVARSFPPPPFRWWPRRQAWSASAFDGGARTGQLSGLGAVLSLKPCWGVPPPPHGRAQRPTEASPKQPGHQESLRTPRVLRYPPAPPPAPPALRPPPPWSEATERAPPLGPGGKLGGGRLAGVTPAPPPPGAFSGAGSLESPSGVEVTERFARGDSSVAPRHHPVRSPSRHRKPNADERRRCAPGRASPG